MGGSWLERYGRPIVALCLVMSPMARSCRADDPPPADRRGTSQRADSGIELFRALQELSTAVDRENRTNVSLSVPELFRKLGRPERVVEPPTLTPEQIDAMLGTVPAAASDPEFLRRVFLDVTGQLPTAEQVEAFERDSDPGKRAKLIDDLLSRPAYGANWARYWRDVIAYRATNPQIRRFGFGRLEQWLAEQLNTNRGWDEIARELITATGSSEDDGRVAFHLAHADQARVQPVEVAGEVSRIFMGVQIQCAQCHDHKTDPWKREQFHEFAAFFAGTVARPNGQPVGLNGFTIQNVPGSPRYTMPDLAEPEKLIPVEPRFFLAESKTPLPSGLTAEQRRAIAASYVTGPDNPWFARAFVNRVWYALMGEAFYSPVDDMGPTREAEHPELLGALARQFAAGGCDVKWLFRTLLATRAYQRSSQGEGSGTPGEALGLTSRLRSDQIFDALTQVLGVPVPGMIPPGRGPLAAGPRGVRNPRDIFGLVFGVDPSTPNDEVFGTIPQALALMNGEAVNRALGAERGTVLARLLAAHPDDADAIPALYVRVLARSPSEQELEIARAHVRSIGQRGEAFEDLFWCLVNSTEFISRR